MHIAYVSYEYLAKSTLYCRFDPQVMVETPFLNIIGRSRASGEDQLKYITYRVEDLKDLQEGIRINGRTYTDSLRFFSGIATTHYLVFL